MVNSNAHVQFLDHDIMIVTENADGDMYVMTAKNIQDILNDWNGDCMFVPANDAPVYFAVWDGKPVNPYDYADFEDLIWFMTRQDDI